MGTRINYSGLVIAGIGFFLTRFTVTLAIYEDPFRFYLAGVVPLVLGLGLAAFGVALTVADVDAALVRTTALWCVIGAVTMLVLVVLTLVGSRTDGMSNLGVARERAYLSNFLIGGSVGGTLTGLYAARNRQQQGELMRQADRLEVLNRFLRHEVLNAVAAIRGFTAIRDEDPRDADEVVNRHSDSIAETIEEVKYLTRTARTSEMRLSSTDVRACLDESIETVTEQYPGATITVTGDEEVSVRATDRLERVFTHLLENAAAHAGTEEAGIEVTIAEVSSTVRISIHDSGPGLPEEQQRLLETGDIDTFDDPGTGFGLNIVRFLVESFNGSIETAVDETGTTVTVVLPREEPIQTGLRPSPTDLAGFRPSLAHLVTTLVISIIAGIAYGLLAELQGGSISGIGVFYGVPDPVVGWITHEFHSIVFGFAFVGIASVVPDRYHDSVPVYLALGVAWGIALWIFAASVVAPAWMQLLGNSAPIPNFALDILVNHVVWGAVLGLLTVLGYRHVTSWFEQIRSRSGSSS
jgi:signal transduction histidine kinase